MTIIKPGVLFKTNKSFIMRTMQKIELDPGIVIRTKMILMYVGFEKLVECGGGRQYFLLPNGKIGFLYCKSPSERYEEYLSKID